MGDSPRRGWRALSSRAFAVMRTRVVRPLIYQWRRRALLRGMDHASEVQLLGSRLRTDPGVFHPLYFSSSRILAERLLAQPLRGRRILDMGTGAGPIAICAAAAGARVTACDINPRAVVLATENAALNGLEVEALESDLFTALAGRRFDLISFNIPFFARDPASHIDAAFNAGRNFETLRRFAQGCIRHLEHDGRAVIILSEDGDRGEVFRAFTESGLALERTILSSSLFEHFCVAWFRVSSPVSLASSAPRA